MKMLSILVTAAAVIIGSKKSAEMDDKTEQKMEEISEMDEETVNSLPAPKRIFYKMVRKCYENSLVKFFILLVVDICVSYIFLSTAHILVKYLINNIRWAGYLSWRFIDPIKCLFNFKNSSKWLVVDSVITTVENIILFYIIYKIIWNPITNYYTEKELFGMSNVSACNNVIFSCVNSFSIGVIEGLVCWVLAIFFGKRLFANAVFNKSCIKAIDILAKAI